jgi:hypothetical protein
MRWEIPILKDFTGKPQLQMNTSSLTDSLAMANLAKLRVTWGLWIPNPFTSEQPSQKSHAN